MITDVRGVRVGHWTDAEAGTGCTVVLLPPGTVASGEVRGGAPGTREFELLAPHRLVTSVDAVVLTGGSAFGLAACDGVVQWCEEQGRGFPTSVARVPIVVGAVIFDLAVGDATVRPGPEQGYAACVSASENDIEVGRVGAGTGATIGNWRGRGAARPGGLGGASERDGDLVVSALMVVNAVGDLARPAADRPPLPPPAPAPATFGENTTIGVIVTNARLDKTSCFLVAQSGHDGLARALEPAHLSVDGDAIVACATAEVETSADRVRILAARAVEAAIRAAVTARESGTTASRPA